MQISAHRDCFMHMQYCVHERARNTILRGGKSLYANIKFAESRWYPTKTNWAVGNDSSKFVSAIGRMSKFIITASRKLPFYS